MRPQCAFTTHTPVPAGHDRFTAELVYRILGNGRATALAQLQLLDGFLNMTELALRLFWLRQWRVHAPSRNIARDVSEPQYPSDHKRCARNDLGRARRLRLCTIGLRPDGVVTIAICAMRSASPWPKFAKHVGTPKRSYSSRFVGSPASARRKGLHSRFCAPRHGV